MKKITYLFLLTAALGACTPKPSNKVETIQPAAFVSIFPKGNAIEGTNFNGTAYLQRLMTDSGTFDVVISDVIFEPKARNSWHSHPGGQILIATAGKGCYQEKGKPIQILNPGDVVAIPADVVHWHGAASDSGFTHIAINTKVHLGATQWYEPVTNEEYDNIKNREMNRNILILFMSWLGVTGYGQATSPNETPITIARQGSFAYAGQC